MLKPPATVKTVARRSHSSDPTPAVHTIHPPALELHGRRSQEHLPRPPLRIQVQLLSRQPCQSPGLSAALLRRKYSPWFPWRGSSRDSALIVLFFPFSTSFWRSIPIHLWWFMSSAAALCLASLPVPLHLTQYHTKPLPANKSQTHVLRRICSVCPS